MRSFAALPLALALCAGLSLPACAEGLKDKAKNMLTFKIEYGVSPLFDGVTRTQSIAFKGDLMVATGSEVKTPEGGMIPINEWKRAK